jgi:hypothetical protein
MEATIAGPATAPERKPVEITPATTAKQLADAVEGSREALATLAENAAWLQAGPYSGRIIQALFAIPFASEEVSTDPAETLARVYLKLRRHWPVYPYASVVWLVGIMREWWGGLPVEALPRTTPQQRPRHVTHIGEDGDWTIPDEIDISFSTRGSTGHVPVSTDYSATIEFTDEDKDALRDIRWRYRNGQLTKSEAIVCVTDFLDERTTDCWCNGNADEGDDHWDETYSEVDRDNESIDEILSRSEAESMVESWDELERA